MGQRSFAGPYIYTLVKLYYTALLKSWTFSPRLSLVSSRPNPKCLGSSHVSIPRCLRQCLCLKKNVLTPSLPIPLADRSAKRSRLLRVYFIVPLLSKAHIGLLTTKLWNFPVADPEIIKMEVTAGERGTYP